jgi:transcriptional regulator with XRE-family HTH domain
MNGRALLAWNLRRLRAERGISQEQLAADAQADRAYISELERQQGNASVDMMDRLAAVIGIPLAEFFRVPEKGAKKAKPLPSGRRPARPKRA